MSEEESLGPVTACRGLVLLQRLPEGMPPETLCLFLPWEDVEQGNTDGASAEVQRRPMSVGLLFGTCNGPQDGGITKGLKKLPLLTMRDANGNGSSVTSSTPTVDDGPGPPAAHSRPDATTSDGPPASESAATPSEATVSHEQLLCHLT
ncbi:hypothetical protein EI94DRAFT_1702379 [Lactarius quietus]|nr:hypothetical protein EI94DRAFT_1702379 [Lactarius quietus]